MATCGEGLEALRIAGSRWPVDGRPIVAFAHRALGSIGELGDGAFDVAVVDVHTQEELAFVAGLRARCGFGLFVRHAAGLDLSPLWIGAHAWREVRAGPLGAAADLCWITRQAPELVRARVLRLAHAAWLDRFADEVHALRHHAALAHFAPAGSARTGLEGRQLRAEHVMAYVGLWTKAPSKAAQHLGTSQPTLRRHRSRWSPAIKAAFAPPSDPGPLRVLCVEPLPSWADGLRRLVESWAARRGRVVAIAAVSSPDVGCRRLRDTPPPQLVCVDVRAVRPDALQRLLLQLRSPQLPVLMIGAADDLPGAHAALAPSLPFAVWDGRVMLGAPEGDGDADTVLDRAAALLDRRARAEAARRETELLAGELGAPRPAWLGAPEAPLSSIGDAEHAGEDGKSRRRRARVGAGDGGQRAP